MANSVQCLQSPRKMEEFLASGAMIPFLGTISGIARVALGILETLGGLIGAFISIPSALSPGSDREDKVMFCVSTECFVTGLKNIVFGAIDSIPLVGSIFEFGVMRWDMRGMDAIDTHDP